MNLSKWLVLGLFAAGTWTLATGAATAQDKTLRVAMNADPDVLDMTQSSNPPQGFATMDNVYDSLDNQAPNGEIIPGVAESWDILDGGKVLVFHLRHGVTFHSGDPLTAKDVVWSHERYLKKGRFYPVFTKFIDKVEAVDDYTVKFTFKQPDAQYLPVHPLPIASKTYYDRVGETEFAKHPVGTGPYKIVNYVPGQYLDLEAYDKYWGPKPQIKKARFFFVQDDNTRVAKLQAGEVDLIMATPYAAYDALKAAGFTEVKLPVHPTQSIQFQLKNPHVPWYDVRVREAIAYAVDKDAIVKGLLHGLPTDYPRLMPDEIGYDPNLKDYKYDPAKARELLNEAGYANGFEMPLYYSTGVYFGTQETTEAVALYLKQNLNITTKPQGMGLIELLGTIFRDAKDPKARYVAVAGLPVANLATALEGIGLAYYGKNAFGSLYDDPEIDKLFEEGNTKLNPAEQAPYIKKIMALEQRDLSTITLWQYVDVYAMRKGVTYTPGLHNLEIVYLPWVHEAM
jgi:peptide/nickel transport system substrate-binding protein